MSRGRWYLTYSCVNEMEVSTFRDGVETRKVPLSARTEEDAVTEGQAKWREIVASYPNASPTVVYEKPIGPFPRTPLELQFAGLWQRLGASTSAEALFGYLERRYEEPHRAYHTLDHVAECLSQLDNARGFGNWHGYFRGVDMDAVELAIWFHDAVYDLYDEDNEGRSAVFAADIAREAGLPQSFGDKLTGLILATKHTSVPRGDDLEARLLVDIDLAILGAAPERFDEYERQIRQEYAHVPDDAFAAGRAKILRSFLDRRSIYATEFFHRRYGAQARQNIERSLARLGA